MAVRDIAEDNGRLPWMALTIVALAAAAGAAGSAHAVTWLSRFSATPPIAIYPDTASGNVAPGATIDGTNVAINGCIRLKYDTEAGEVHCADFTGQAIAVFAATASGNVAPLRRFTNPAFIGQARAAMRIPGREEVVVLRPFTSGIVVFPRSADGPALPIRSISGAVTQITNPSGLEYLPANDEIAVGDFFPATSPIQGELLFFTATAGGNIAPTRRMTSAAFGEFILDLEHVPERPGELFVLVSDPAVAGISANRVVVVAAGGNGAVTPLREIGGGNTMLQQGGSMTYDAASDEIRVTTNSNFSAARVVSFPASGSGNLVPLRTLSGSSVGAPFSGIVSFTIDPLFRDSFEN